jgi:hypothetical protein
MGREPMKEVVERQAIAQPTLAMPKARRGKTERGILVRHSGHVRAAPRRRP